MGGRGAEGCRKWRAGRAPRKGGDGGRRRSGKETHGEEDWSCIGKHNLSLLKFVIAKKILEEKKLFRRIVVLFFVPKETLVDSDISMV